MNESRTITATIEVNNVTAMFTTYQRYLGNNQATYDDLFHFLSSPTPEREEFLALHCSCSYSSTGNIVSPKYKSL